MASGVFRQLLGGTIAFMYCATCHADLIEGAAFRHVVIRNDAAERGASEPSRELHVYIEGDGVPAARFGGPARDPTSRVALMLRLMRLDPSPSVYLGRPCYQGLSTDRHCNAHYWTDRRFSVEVLTSMQAALARETARAAARRVVLLGHSGGGTLAVLLAQRTDAVDAVLTVAGNLDTDAWTALHGFAPLEGSLNPATQGRLPPSVRAVHLVGSKDRVVTPSQLRRAVAVVGGTLLVVDGFTHDCCWAERWPDYLGLLERARMP